MCVVYIRRVLSPLYKFNNPKLKLTRSFEVLLNIAGSTESLHSYILFFDHILALGVVLIQLEVATKKRQRKYSHSSGNSYKIVENQKGSEGTSDDHIHSDTSECAQPHQSCKGFDIFPIRLAETLWNYLGIGHHELYEVLRSDAGKFLHHLRVDLISIWSLTFSLLALRHLLIYIIVMLKITSLFF